MILLLLGLTLQIGPRKTEINTLHFQNLDYVTLKEVSQYFDISFFWNDTNKTLILQKEAMIILIPDCPFVKIEENVIQLKYPPVLLDNDIYLTVNELPKILNPLLNKEFILKNNVLTAVKSMNVYSFTIKATSKKTEASLKFSPNLETIYRGSDTLWVVTIFDAIFNPEIFPKKGKGLIKRIEIKYGEGFLELRFIVDKGKDVDIKRIDGEIKIIVKERTVKKIRTIVIDPGHGGMDPGAQANGLSEKDIVLKIAKYTAKNLTEMGFNVILTRTTDTFLPLKKRTEIADNAKADLFVSIHCNATGNKRMTRMHGTETYFLSAAKTDWARAVEATENASIKFEDKNIETASLKYVLSDLAQNQFLQESQNLAIDIQDQIVDECKTYNRGVSQANFFVLRVNYMPAVLVETLFLTSPEDAKKLKDINFLKKIGKGIADGIQKYTESRS